MAVITRKEKLWLAMAAIGVFLLTACSAHTDKYANMSRYGDHNHDQSYAAAYGAYYQAPAYYESYYQLPAEPEPAVTYDMPAPVTECPDGSNLHVSGACVREEQPVAEIYTPPSTGYVPAPPKPGHTYLPVRK